MNINKDKIFLTREGFESLKKEYHQLVEAKRPKIVEKLADSRQAGDLAENSEYTQAREELSFIDGRISELENVINNAVLIDNNHLGCHQVNLGCKVTVKMNNRKNQVFHLVGEWEADPTAQKISYTSPLGKSLLGKKVGERVEIEAPVGRVVCTITKIE